MGKTAIPKEAFALLKDLAANNNRDWFNENKKHFKTIESNVKDFYVAVQEKLNTHDTIEKLKMFRIYRDVRFSKDKTPFKTHFAGSWSRAGEQLRGGYYLRIKPSESFLATGFWEPNKEDLFRIRKEIETDAADFKNVVESPKLVKTWGKLQGDAVKTAPKGFNKEHPDIEYIRQKQFIFVKNITDKEVMSADFLELVNTAFKDIRPFFDLMSDILTTNLNGESLLR